MVDHEPDTRTDTVYLVVGRKGVEEFDRGRLRAARRAANLDQQQLAERAGVSPSTLSAVERGVNRPDAPLLRRLAEALGVDVLKLLAPGTPVTLRVLRYRAGLTQVQLAERIPGMSRGVLAQVERGQRDLRDDEIGPAAAALAVTAAEVVRAVHAPALPPEVVQLPPDLVAVLRGEQRAGESLVEVLRRLLPPAGD